MGVEYNILNDDDFNKFDQEDAEDISFLILGEGGLAVAGFVGLIVLVVIFAFFRVQIKKIVKG